MKVAAYAEQSYNYYSGYNGTDRVFQVFFFLEETVNAFYVFSFLGYFVGQIYYFTRLCLEVHYIIGN